MALFWLNIDETLHYLDKRGSFSVFSESVKVADVVKADLVACCRPHCPSALWACSGGITADPPGGVMAVRKPERPRPKTYSPGPGRHVFRCCAVTGKSGVHNLAVQLASRARIASPRNGRRREGGNVEPEAHHHLDDGEQSLLCEDEPIDLAIGSTASQMAIDASSRRTRVTSSVSS